MSLADDVGVITPYGGARPPIPTRDQLIAVRTTGMQGLTLNGHPMLDWYLTSPDLTAADRQAYYTLKHTAGDTHCLLALTWNYQESGSYAPAGFDGTLNWSRFLAILDEVLTAGFYVSLHLGGDALSVTAQAPWRYNDPAGWTYGWQWLLAELPTILAQIGDRAPYLVWCSGFDGCIPAWAGPENDWSRTNQWIQRFRQVCGPDAVLFLYLSSGYWAWSGEHDDYQTPDGQQVDGVYYEGPIPFGPPAPYDRVSSAPWDQIWQISKRLLCQAYRRPADQPADDDPGTWPGTRSTPRGVFASVFLEFATYPWVRGAISPDTLAWQRAYLRACGWAYTG